MSPTAQLILPLTPTAGPRGVSEHGLHAAPARGDLDDDDARKRIAADLMDKVERAHGLEGFADRLIDVLQSVIRGHAPGGGAVENESKVL